MTGRLRCRDEALGLTLVELMTVIAIIGVLSMVAVASMNRRADIQDAASALSGMLQEVSRQAISKGPVRPDVVTAAIGGDDDPLTPTRLRIFDHPDSGLQAVTIERTAEYPEPSTGYELEVLREFTMPQGSEIYGFLTFPDTDGGQTQGALTAIGSEQFVRCRADGSCDPITLYLHTTGNQKAYVRVVVMPLNGAPIVFQGW